MVPLVFLPIPPSLDSLLPSQRLRQVVSLLHPLGALLPHPYRFRASPQCLLQLPPRFYLFLILFWLFHCNGSAEDGEPPRIAGQLPETAPVGQMLEGKAVRERV